MKVSIVMITYNHEKFIAQAVESVLMQQTNFDYELIIGEDCSTDRTRDIIVDYQKKNPDKIRLLLHEKNLGGRIPGKNNFVQTLNSATGQYVCLLEGDDFWTSPDKLQKQADFLDSHPDFAMCFHNATVLYDDGSRATQPFCPTDQKAVSTIEDLLKGNFIIACSTMFRRGLFGPLPDWFYEVTTGDWALHVLNAHHGKIGYLDAVMGCYRVHGAGVWSGQNRPALVSRKLELLQAFQSIDSHFNFFYKDIIEVEVAKNRPYLVVQSVKQSGLKKARQDIKNARVPLNDVSDALVFEAADSLDRGENRSARAALLAALRLHPRRAMRLHTFKMLFRSFLKPGGRCIRMAEEK